MSDEEPASPKDKDTTARYVWKTAVLLLSHSGRPFMHYVSSRDISKVFEDPVLAQNFNGFVLIKFFDQMFAKVKAEDGKEYNTEGGKVNGSPVFFLPNWGRIYTVDEVKDKDDPRSKNILCRLKHLDITAGFLNEATGELLPADPANGDRVLEESEISNFSQMAGKREKSPESSTKEVVKQPERKRIFPITPDKITVN